MELDDALKYSFLQFDPAPRFQHFPELEPWPTLTAYIFRELKPSFIILQFLQPRPTFIIFHFSWTKTKFHLISIAGEESHTWRAVLPTTSSKLEMTAKSYFGPNNNLSTLFKSVASFGKARGPGLQYVVTRLNIHTPIISVTSFSADTSAEEHPKWENPHIPKEPLCWSLCGH